MNWFLLTPTPRLNQGRFSSSLLFCFVSPLSLTWPPLKQRSNQSALWMTWLWPLKGWRWREERLCKAHAGKTRFVALCSNIPPPLVCVPSNTVRQSATVSTALGLVIIDSKSVYLVWLPKDEWYRRYKILIFLHDTLAHDDASLYQGWLQRGSAVEEISSRWTFIEILNLFLWPWPWPQQSCPIFSQDNPAYEDVPSNKV